MEYLTIYCVLNYHCNSKLILSFDEYYLISQNLRSSQIFLFYTIDLILLLNMKANLGILVFTKLPNSFKLFQLSRTNYDNIHLIYLLQYFLGILHSINIIRNHYTSMMNYI